MWCGVRCEGGELVCVCVLCVFCAFGCMVGC